MTEMSTEQLYDFYIDTIGRCTSELRNLTNEEIEYNLFEEFDVGVHSFLHDDNLAKLRDGGFIDNETLALYREVRQRWLALQKPSWSIEEVKTGKSRRFARVLRPPRVEASLTGATGEGQESRSTTLFQCLSKTGVPRSEFEVTKWGRDRYGKSFSTEWRHPSAVGDQHRPPPFQERSRCPHVGWQTGGKRGSGGEARPHHPRRRAL